MKLVKQIMIQSELLLVWKAWTEAHRLAEWFAPEAAIDLQEGGMYELYFNPSNKESMSTRGCKVLKLDAPHTLVFQWKGPDPFAEVMNNPEELTQVEVQLEAHGQDTLVTLCHSGWNYSESSQAAQQWHEQAWEQMLSSLKSNLESGKGVLCCQ